MSDPFRRAIAEFDGEFPDTWKPEPGQMLVGTLVRYEGPIKTKYTKAGSAGSWIAVIYDEDLGKEWAVWLLETVLVQEFAMLAPDPGERVGIRYMGVKEGQEDSYKHFIVRVDRAGGQAHNPFRKPAQAAQSPPADQPSPPRSGEVSRAPAPAPSQEPPVTELQQLTAEWDNWLRRYRVEEWAEEALAQAHPDLHEKLRQWGIDDYRLALQLVRHHGAGLFTAAGAKMGEKEPAAADLVAKVKELLEQASAKDKLRAGEALDSGWQDAAVWASELLAPTKLPPAEEVFGPDAPSGSTEPDPAKPSLEEPEDDLPF